MWGHRARARGAGVGSAEQGPLRDSKATVPATQTEVGIHPGERTTSPVTARLRVGSRTHRRLRRARRTRRSTPACARKSLLPASMRAVSQNARRRVTRPSPMCRSASRSGVPGAVWHLAAGGRLRAARRVVRRRGGPGRHCRSCCHRCSGWPRCTGCGRRRRQHAREAAAVGHDGVQHLAAFGDSGATLSRNTGVPDRPFGVRADAVGSRTWSEVGPNTPVHQLTGVR
jgi:hypothetical protein